MLRFIAFTILVNSTLLCSCAETKKEFVEVKKTVQEEKIVLENLPDTIGDMLFNNCDNLDGTFYNTNQSFNIFEDNVKHILKMINGPAPDTLTNKMVGHLMLLENGEELVFVELYMDADINYVVYKVEEKKYYNTFTESGLKFFRNLAIPK